MKDWLFTNIVAKIFPEYIVVKANLKFEFKDNHIKQFENNTINCWFTVYDKTVSICHCSGDSWINNDLDVGKRITKRLR